MTDASSCVLRVEGGSIYPAITIVNRANVRPDRERNFSHMLGLQCMCEHEKACLAFGMHYSGRCVICFLFK